MRKRIHLESSEGCPLCGVFSPEDFNFTKNPEKVTCERCRTEMIRRLSLLEPEKKEFLFKDKWGTD